MRKVRYKSPVIGTETQETSDRFLIYRPCELCDGCSFIWVRLNTFLTDHMSQELKFFEAEMAFFWFQCESCGSDGLKNRQQPF